MLEIFIVSFVVTFIILIIVQIVKLSKNNKHEKEAKKVLFHLKNFNVDDSFISKTSGLSVGLDYQGKRICFLSNKNTPTIYKYNELLQCELIVDSETISKTTISSTVGRSVLGGIIGGEAGAIIGGLTGGRIEKKKVRSVDLKMIVDNIKNPINNINFLNTVTNKNSTNFKDAYSEADRWHVIISRIINEKNMEIHIDNNHVSKLSIADEIMKLKKLFDSGIITNEEFSKQRANLLN